MIVLAALWVGVAAPAAPRSDRSAVAMEMLRKYAPAGYQVVHQYDHTPWAYKQPGCSISMTRADFMAFVQGSTPMEMAAGLPTAVHETCHSYNIKMAWYYMEKRSLGCGHFMAYPMNLDEVAVVRVTPTFPAVATVARVPAAARTHRFETYISRASRDQTTQKFGIYGLVDEFNAYSQGTRTAVDLVSFYEREAPLDPRAWLQCFQAVNGVSAARLEFKIFILAYLAEAKARNPAMYRAFVANRELMRAFFRVDAHFAATMQRYRQIQGGVLSRLRARGVTVSENERFLTIGDRGVGTNTLEEQKLNAVLAQPAFRSLEQELRSAVR